MGRLGLFFKKQTKPQARCGKWENKSKVTRNNAKWVKKKTADVSHSGLAIYIKRYLKSKEELWKLKYFTMQN
jgi:hypothetical protein